MLDKQGLFNVLNLDVDSDAPCFIIYSDVNSERLKYTVEFIFKIVLKANYILIDDFIAFENAEGFKINYSAKNSKNGFQILPHSLLFETTISESKPIPFFKDNLIYFFENKNGNFNFDVFSSAFYFISRYEEWQSFQPDSHLRFEADQSLLFKYNFHLKPMVEIWIMELKTKLQTFYNKLNLHQQEFKIISTIDVDNLFAYKHKGFFRTMGGFIKDIFRKDLKNFTERYKVLSGQRKDPFDMYDLVCEFCSKNKIPLIYFFLFKNKTKYDRTINPNSKVFHALLKNLINKNVIVGIHPSYNSSHHSKSMQNEIKNLSNKIKNNIIISRQHFLRFDIKTTPKLLMKNGILADFSMGFASKPGFRAGTSRPFYHYDFTSEKKNNFLLIPFCAMDGAYLHYDKVNPKLTNYSLFNLALEIKKVNGLFITVFHERTFSNFLHDGFGDLYMQLHLKVNQL